MQNKMSESDKTPSILSKKTTVQKADQTDIYTMTFKAFGY